MAQVDFGKQPQFLAGWSESRARDNLMNDSFCAFAVHLKSEEYKTDHKEIFEAAWFDTSELMAAWVRLGKPMEKKVCMDVGQRSADPKIVEANKAAKAADPKARGKDDGERNVMQGNVLKWLDTYVSGKGHPVTKKETMHGDQLSVKASWGMAR